MEIIYSENTIWLCIFSYLCGSVMSAMVVIRILHLRDPRESGSGNPGASNMLRLHGRVVGILTLTGDAAKGILPLLLARLMDAPELTVTLCGLAAFCGHLFPLFHRFKGGKGVATLLGVLWVMHWQLGLTFSICWLLLAALTRYSSLAAMGATLATLVTSIILLPQSAYAVGPAMVLLFWKHRSNMRNLVNGTEPRIGG